MRRKAPSFRAEVFFIDKLQSCNREFGYNLKSGGDGNGKHSEETKLLLSQIAKASGQKPNVNPNANISIKRRSELSINYGSNPFNCHTKNGVYIGDYVSFLKPIDTLKRGTFTVTGIPLTGKTPHEAAKLVCISVDCVQAAAKLKGEAVGHASTELGLLKHHIRNNLKGRKKTCCGYVFKYI